MPLSAQARQYELTFAACDSTLWGKYGPQTADAAPEATAYYGCPGSPSNQAAGGTNKFLAWCGAAVRGASQIAIHSLALSDFLVKSVLSELKLFSN